MTTAAAPREIQRYVRGRDGLGDLPARLRREDCTIAYLGASVTVQKDGYRPRLHEQIRQATGRQHRPVAAGTGAMGSITGVFLMDRLVLPHSPDLCFVEYTTSDSAGTTPLEHLGPALEGIVCKLRDAGSEVCFLHLYRGDCDLGGAGPVVDVYEQVADHYGVPSINVAAYVRDGGIPPDAVLRDAVHTTAAGSDLAADAVARGLGVLRSRTRTATPPPLFAESFRRTHIVAATAALVPDGACEIGTFRFAYPYVEVGASTELRLEPDGELVGLIVILGPASGFIEVEAGGVHSEYLLWDEDCSYDRLGSVVFDPFAPAGGPVTIRVADRPVAGAAPVSKRLKLVGLMVRP